MSPYELINSRLPRTSFDWSTPKTEPQDKLSITKAQEITGRIEDTIKRGKENIEQAQKKIEKYVNAKRRPVDFAVGDKVYISTKN
jgi:hypothetical protein